VPRVDFEVRIRPTPTVSSTTLSIDGQAIEYHNGPEQWTTMHWPADGATHGASVRARGVNGLDEVIQEDGEWGLFRLIEAGTVRGDPAARIFSVTWTLRDQGIEVGMDVRPARAENPFLGVPGRTTHASFLQPMRADGLAPIPRSLARETVACDTAAGAAPPPMASERHHHHHHHSHDEALVSVNSGPRS
jgi:type VI secretion system protein ImpL